MTGCTLLMSVEDDRLVQPIYVGACVTTVQLLVTNKLVYLNLSYMSWAGGCGLDW